MTTERLTTELEDILKAGGIIRNGGLVAFPTETVYGLGANALDEDAVRSVYAAKGRPSDNPMIVHISDSRELVPIVKGGQAGISEDAGKAMRALWPGLPPFAPISTCPCSPVRIRFWPGCTGATTPSATMRA